MGIVIRVYTLLGRLGILCRSVIGKVVTRGIQPVKGMSRSVELLLGAAGLGSALTCVGLCWM